MPGSKTTKTSKKYKALLQACCEGDYAAYVSLKDKLRLREAPEPYDILLFLFARHGNLKDLRKFPLKFIDDLIVWLKESRPLLSLADLDIQKNLKNAELMLRAIKAASNNEPNNCIELLDRLLTLSTSPLSEINCLYVLALRGEQYYVRQNYIGAIMDLLKVVDPNLKCVFLDTGLKILNLQDSNLTTNSLFSRSNFSAFEKAKIFFLLGASCYQVNDLDGSIYAFSNAINHNPVESSYYSCRATRYFQQKKYELAMYDYLVALRLDPANDCLYFSCASVCFKNKDHVGAIYWCSGAID